MIFQMPESLKKEIMEIQAKADKLDTGSRVLVSLTVTESNLVGLAVLEYARKLGEETEDTATALVKLALLDKAAQKFSEAYKAISKEKA